MATYEIALLVGIVILITGYIIGRAHLRLTDGVLVIAIALLVTAAIATVRWQTDFAKQLAIITYYFLITGVILRLISFIREGSGKK